jgi:hypothetical protein
LRIEAFEVRHEAEQELVSIADLGHQRRAPRADFLVVLPNRLAGLLIGRQQEVAPLPLVWPAPENGQIAI